MIAKVISTCFRQKDKRVEINKHVFPEHLQDCEKPLDALEILKYAVEFEDKYPAGEKVDTIIVNNDTGFSEGNEYIRMIDGWNTRNGKIISYTRPNIGWSFGGFNDAFQRFKDGYDYWIFTEDDILIGGDNYAKKLRERFEQIKSLNIPIGYLSLLKVIRHPYGIHCGGGIGFTSREILEKVMEHFGKLPHHDYLNGDKKTTIQEGEVAFTNKIDALGYYLFDFGENKSWDIDKNLCIPYYNLKHDIH